MKHPTYPEYKESGVQWLGQVPGHWEVWKLSHGFQNTGSGTTPPSDNDAWYDGDIPWVTTSELRESIIFDTTKRVSEDAIVTFSALKLFPKGSLAIAMYGATIGRLGILGVPATTNQACCVMYGERALNARFMFLWFQAFREQVVLLSSGGGQPNISQDKIRSIRVACPPLPEQTAIADFLDLETGRFDTLVAKKRRLIALLKEKRTALISRTVTRGLPAEAAREFGLEPHTCFKDSGIEWLGEVPEGWEVRRLKDVGNLLAGAGFPHEFQGMDNEEYPFFKVGDLTSSSDGRKMTRGEHSISRKIASILRARIIPPNSIIYAKIGAALLLNRRRITTTPCCIDNNMTAFVPNAKKVDTAFGFYWLSTLDFGEFTNPGAVPSLSEGYQSTLPITLPPRSEQTAIATYLDRETAKIDQLVAKVETVIARLQEYRTAMITAAVTGKIDVREAAT